jgi:hypothetical protein
MHRRTIDLELEASMSADQATVRALSTLSGAVNPLHRRTLDAIFQHPLSHNLSWRAVVSLFDAIGGADEKHDGAFLFRLGDAHLWMKTPHTKDLTGDEVIDLRHFIVRSGWSPDAAPSQQDRRPSEPGLIVVIDHAGAKVYRIDADSDGEHEAAPEPKHLLHHVDRKAHDKDREETYPNDERFFEGVAAAASGNGKIVVIGHGKGQSNEADHWSAYLKAHHKETYARIVREIVADLPRLTTPELLEIGRHALA